jgi:hypothetical protein
LPARPDFSGDVSLTSRGRVTMGVHRLQVIRADPHELVEALASALRAV